METKTYRVIQRKIPDLAHKIELLNRRAKRLGCPEIIFKATGRIEDENLERDGELVGVRRFEFVEITGESPKFNGWELAAIVERTSEGNILRKTPYCKVELEAFRDCPPRCQHCNLERNRRDTFLVLHESGSVKQVGSDCIRDFLGHNSPEYLAKLAEIAFTVSELCDSEYQDLESEPYDGERIRELLPVDTFLAYVVCARRKLGFISGKRAKEDFTGKTESTAQTALCWMFPPRNTGIKFPRPDDNDREFGRSTQEFVLNRLESQERLSDFEHNLLVAAKVGAVEFRSAGLVAYLVEYRCKELEKDIARKDSRHFGEPKKRYRNVPLVYLRSTGFDSRFGWTFVNILQVSGSGEKLVWRTSKEQDWIPGNEFNATFTVKAHSEFRGNLQTEITRLSIDSITEPVTE